MRNETGLRIKVPNHLWWYGLLVSLTGLVIGYIVWTAARDFIPTVTETWQNLRRMPLFMNLPLIAGQALSLVVLAFGSVLAIYCFFYGIRLFVPVRVPTLAPKDYRNQQQVPEMISQGVLRTFYIPNSYILALLKKILPNVRNMTREPKKILIANLRFVLAGGITSGILLTLYHFRDDILSLLTRAGLNTRGVFVPQVMPIAQVILIAIVLRLIGAILLVRIAKPEARSLLHSTELEYEAHPNIVYAATQRAAETIRAGEFPNRITIDDTKLVPPKPEGDGVFDGLMLIESYPQYYSAAHTLSSLVLTLFGSVFLVFGLRHFLMIDYPVAPLTWLDFLEQDMPLRIRDVLVLLAFLAWGRVMLLQAVRLVKHYRFSSEMMLVEFKGSYRRTTSSSGGSEEKDTAGFRCKTQMVIRGTRAISEAYHLWGGRELIRFYPSEKTDEFLRLLATRTEEELTRDS